MTIYPDASVHEKTVQRIAVESSMRRPRRVARRRATMTWSVTVHPAVWATAVRLAQGNHKRLVIRSATEVSVLNQPRGGKA